MRWKMSRSVRDMSLRGWAFPAGICTGEDNDSVLTIALTQSNLSRCVATADNLLTDNRMAAILILFSCANISD
jgi:hypothetical protein